MTEQIEMKPPENGVPAAPKTKQILLDVKVDGDRLKKYLTLDEYIAFESGEGGARAGKALVAANLWDATNKVYIDYEEAKVLLGKMTLEQATQLFERLMDDLGEEAVPKEYAIASGSD